MDLVTFTEEIFVGKLQYLYSDSFISFLFFKLRFTPYKAEQLLRGMDLQEKEAQKDFRIQEICLEKTYS